MKRRGLAVLVLLAMVASVQIGCASGITNLKKTIIITHSDVYLPAMTELGKQLDAGKISPAKEAQIQKLSEDYQTLKTAADAAIQSGVLSRAEIALKLVQLASFVAQLQQIAGGLR